MTTPTYVLVPDLASTGDAQMGIDQQLFDAVEAGNITGALRFYRFDPPCVTIGRHQRLSTVDEGACAKHGIDIVRRQTGGTAVYHASTDITYAFACRTDHAVFGGGVIDSCRAIHDVVQAALAWMDIPTTLVAGAPGEHQQRPDCFAEPATSELVDFQGRKLVGSAQRRGRTALLQHGLIPMDRTDVAQYIPGAAPLDTRTSIHSIAPNVSWEAVVAQLKNSFATALGTPLVETGILLSESAGVG